MEYNSFYGGRRGASFVIVKRYGSIPEMTADFAKGPSFTDVNFDQYVIIDTKDKNDLDNGKIFRRGYDFDSDRIIYYKMAGNDGTDLPPGEQATHKIQAKGAEYIGTIIGPSGKSPVLKITELAAILEKHGQYGIRYIVDTLFIDLTNKYIDYADLVQNKTVEKYQQEIIDLTEQREDIEIKVEDATIKQRMINKINSVIASYQELIENVQASAPEQENEIDRLVSQLNTYVELEEDYDNPRFYENGQWIKYYKRDGGQTTPFKIYKIKLNQDGSYKYQGNPQDWEQFNNKMLGFGQGSYDAQEHIDLVPGKDEQGNFNDVVEYAYLTIEGQREDNRPQAWIGFKFPYLVNEFTTTTVTQYNASGNYSQNTSKIQRIDDTSHPFYQKWRISVPKGIKGNSVTDLQVRPNGDYNNKTWLFADITDYDTKQAGTVTSIPIASYDVINSVSVSANGIINITFTGSAIQDYIGYLDFVKAINIADNGAVTYTMTGKDSTGEYSKPGGTIKSLRQTNSLTRTSEGKYVLHYNTGDSTELNFNYIIGFEVINGQVWYEYVDGTRGRVENIDVDEYQKFNSFELLNDGTVNIIWNDDTGQEITPHETIGQLKYPTKIQILTDGKIKTTFSDNTTSTTSTSSFVYPNEISFNKTTGKFQYTTNASSTKQNMAGEPIEYPNGLSFSAANGKLQYTTNLNSTAQNVGGDTIVYPTELRYNPTGSPGVLQYKNNNSNTYNNLGTIEHPTIFSYNDTTGKITYITNVNSTAKDTGSIIEHPKTLTYNDSTGIFSSTSNLNNTTQIGTIEYTKSIQKDYDNTEHIYKLQTVSNAGTQTDIYSLDKDINDLRLTSDQHIVVKYNNINNTDSTITSTLPAVYTGSDINYTGGAWRDIGNLESFGAKQVIVLNESEADISHLPSNFATGGIMFVSSST